jgi:hypothetical protein
LLSQYDEYEFNTADISLNPMLPRVVQFRTTGSSPTAFCNIIFRRAAIAEDLDQPGRRHSRAGRSQFNHQPTSPDGVQRRQPDPAQPRHIGLANAGNIRAPGPVDNFPADRQRVEDALMGRINPQLDIQKQQLQQQLVSGHQYGSQAYNNAFIPYNQRPATRGLPPSIRQTRNAHDRRGWRTKPH